MGDVFVEFFSDEALENVMCMLQYKPERLIFLGHPHTMLTRKKESLSRFSARRSPETVLEFIEVPRDDINQCIDALSSISERYPDARYELTGGGEMLLIAFGYISAGRPLKTLRIDPFTGTEIILEPKAKPVQRKDDIRMTVADNIVLHGGMLTGATGSFSTWKMNDDLKHVIRTVWEISKKLKSSWNHYCAIIETVMKDYPGDDSGIYRLPKAALREAVDVFYKLNQAELLTDFRVQKKFIEFKFRNRYVKNIIIKTGNILELHVYEVASRRPDIFTDEVIGAMIDWNASKPNAQGGAAATDSGYQTNFRTNYDTINEIDVILMNGCIPTFISCKSGRAGSSALHELQTVTHRFGGMYAKKALVMAGSADSSQSGVSFFKQRAKEMKIWLIDNVYNMSDEDLLKKLIRIQGN